MRSLIRRNWYFQNKNYLSSLDSFMMHSKISLLYCAVHNGISLCMIWIVWLFLRIYYIIYQFLICHKESKKVEFLITKACAASQMVPSPFVSHSWEKNPKNPKTKSVNPLNTFTFMWVTTSFQQGRFPAGTHFIRRGGPFYSTTRFCRLIAGRSGYSTFTKKEAWLTATTKLGSWSPWNWLIPCR